MFFSDKTEIIVPPKDKKVDKGSRIDLRCEAIADKRLELKYQWKMDNAIIKYSNKIQWLEGENVLTIDDITVDDAGIYTCVAYTPSPKESSDEASASVDIAGKVYPREFKTTYLTEHYNNLVPRAFSSFKMAVGETPGQGCQSGSES